MRGFWRCLAGLSKLSIFVFAFLFATKILFAFDQTSGTKTDATKFNGMSSDEVESLKLQQLQNAYLQTVYDRIKKFEGGDKSSKYGAQAGGRYSGYGEAHIQNGDAMISHEGGANGLEGAVEKGALGSLGLSGQAREDANQKAMDKNCPVDKTTGRCTNVATGKTQDRNHDISAALYDAGPAHGADDPKKGDEPHRVYAVTPGVRSAVEANGAKYAAMTIKDATLAPGKQPNLDLLHKEFSKMEQDKYIMMASDAFAFRSARLSGTDTSIAANKTKIGEFKQIAIDVYADPQFAGNVQAAEGEIQKRLVDRVAVSKVVGGKTLCADGKVEPATGCPTTGAPTDPTNITDADGGDAAAAEILKRLGTNPDGVKKTALIKALGLTKASNPAQATPISVNNLMKSLSLKDLSGIVDRAKLDDLYGQAQQKLKPDEQTQIGEYKGRLQSNQCLSFTSFCYSSGVGQPLNPKQAPAAGTSASAIAAAAKSQIAKDEFQKVSGDPGGYFNDTRELLFNNFAYAYNRPLSEWKNTVTNADFNAATDKGIKDKGTYKEFSTMYKKAMDEAGKIQSTVDSSFIQRLVSAGATKEQIAQVQKNYGRDGKNNFDATQLSHMKLFGQNKDRDAVMMDWRKGVNKYINPNYQNTNTSTVPTAKSQFTAQPSTPSTPSSPTLK